MSDSHALPPAHLAAAHLAAAHLAAERLAALADETPTAEEAAHLGACPACRREQEAYVALLDLARTEGAEAADGPLYADERGHVASPPASWDALAATLRAEGLVRSAADGASPGAATRRAARAWARPGAWRRGGAAGVARLAAAMALAVSAGAAGRWSAAHGPWAMAGVAAAPRATDPAVASYASPETVRAALARARADYARAAAFLGDADPTGEPTATDSSSAPRAHDARDAELLRARLAALDAMLPRVRAAAREAPQDPAVNHVYLTAYDAREAALRQLGRTLPAGVQLTGY